MTSPAAAGWRAFREAINAQYHTTDECNTAGQCDDVLHALDLIGNAALAAEQAAEDADK